MRLFLFAIFLSCTAVQGAEPGKVCDRNGVVLMKMEWKDDGTIVRKFPFKAFAAHLLSDLRADVLPKQGETVFLTIDVRAQVAAETALRAVPRGCAILVDPKNGDVLAMASVPSFDPGAFDEKVLSEDETAPLVNRATSAYAPGALYLPVTLLSGISAGLGNFEYTCTGSRQFGSRVMRCWIAHQGGGHGPEKLIDGLRNSCNTYFYSLGVAVGPDKMAFTAEALGLGRPSGLPLKNEAPGVLGDPKSLAQTNPLEKWSDGYTANVAIGQGMVTATPLQMASLAATLADGDAVRQLRLIDRVVFADGRKVRPDERIRTSLKDLGISSADFSLVRAALLASVNDAGGNAPKGRIPGFQVGGRTGTAQFWRNGKKDNHTAFLGFAESEKASYAFCVFVQGAKSGGGVAVPLAARIVSSIGKHDPVPLEPAKGSVEAVE